MAGATANRSAKPTVLHLIAALPRDHAARLVLISTTMPQSARHEGLHLIETSAVERLGLALGGCLESVDLVRKGRRTKRTGCDVLFLGQYPRRRSTHCSHSQRTARFLNFWWESPLPLTSVIGACVAGLISAYLLVDGFRTGVMKSFVSLALLGSANRKSNPAWFWTWAGLNFLLVVLAIMVSAKPAMGLLFPCSVNRC